MKGRTKKVKGQQSSPTLTASKGLSSTKALTRGVSGAHNKRPYDEGEVMGPIVVQAGSSSKRESVFYVLCIVEWYGTEKNEWSPVVLCSQEVGQV